MPHPPLSRRILATAFAAAIVGAIVSNAPAVPSAQAATPTPQSVRALIDDGRYFAAESTARVLVAAARAAPRADSMAYAEAAGLHAEVLSRLARAKRLETIELAEAAVRNAERARGPQSAELATSLLVRGLQHFWAGEAAASRDDCRRALGIRESTFGPDHPLTATAIAYLARAVADSSFAAAQPLFERALAIRRKALPADSPDLARSMFQLAWDRMRQGDADSSRVLFEGALAIQERVLQPEHPDLANTLYQYGYLTYELGRYPRVRELDQRALAIREKSLGPDHPDCGHTHNDLGLVAIADGDFDAAREHLPKAVAILDRNPGPDPSGATWAHMNLATLDVWTGDLGEARREYDRALSIKERVRGPVHADVATVLNMYGQMLEETGDLAGAQAMFERASAIMFKLRGRASAGGLTAINLANVLVQRRQFARADSLYAEVLAAREKRGGPDSPIVFDPLLAGAASRFLQGDAAGSRPLAERALSIATANDMGVIDVAAITYLLAGISLIAGHLDSARVRLTQAESLMVKGLGPRDPYVVEIREARAELLAATGEPRAAFDLSLDVEDLGRERVMNTIAAFSERQALAYSAMRPRGLDLALTLATREADGHARARAWDAVLRGRALVLDEFAQRHRQVADIGRRARALTEASERLANLAVRGPGDEGADAYREMLDKARDQKERAERELAEFDADFRQQRNARRASLADIASALPERSALVGYVAYARWEGMRKRPAGARTPPDSLYAKTPSYLAFVLRSGESEPTVTTLGSRAVVDSLVTRWSEAISRGARVPRTWMKEAAYRPVGEALRRAIWDPVASRLGGVDRVFVVPDGALHLVNLATLPSGEAGYLIESGPLLQLLSAERDLLVPESKPTGGGLLALGGVSFEGAPMVLASAAASGSAGSSSTPAYRGGRATCGDFESLHWDAVPGTEAEARRVAGIWSDAPAGGGRATGEVTLLLGAEAGETAFKELAPRRRVLHLATHGFFIGRGCETPSQATTVGYVRSDAPATVENPLLLSGLALAGANHRREAGPGQDDGVLTAEEVAALDLSDVELAVLSACETGVGEVRTGEGVFGLRRAFQIAGARTLVMSLWSVEDQATRRWMEALYDAHLRRGLPTAEAVRQASLDVLRERREHRESAHPFYWGAFVAAGDWR